MRKRLKISALLIALVIGGVYGYNNLSATLQLKNSISQEMQDYCENLQENDLFYLEGVLMVLEEDDNASEVDLEKYETCQVHFPAEYL